jgi:hypothetical protein
MVINVSPETEKQLVEAAARIGARVADYAGFLLERTLRGNGNVHSVNGAQKSEREAKAKQPNALAHAMAELSNQTPEEREQARQRLLEVSRPPRPLPEGKTFLDVVCGQWPGDETDEQVFEALRKLS